MPPLMKLWVDDVLTFGWAYGPGGTALNGKDLWLVASTGGARGLVPARWLQPLLLRRVPAAVRPDGGAVRHALPAAAGAAWRARGRRGRDRRACRHACVERLRSYPDWPELAASAGGAGDSAVASGERPDPSSFREDLPDGLTATGSCRRLVDLAAAVIAVPVSRLLKLGSVIGYLVAGMLWIAELLCRNGTS